MSRMLLKGLEFVMVWREKLLRYFHFRHSGKEGASEEKILKAHMKDNSEQDEVHAEKWSDGVKLPVSGEVVRFWWTL